MQKKGLLLTKQPLFAFLINLLIYSALVILADIGVTSER
jgi:hypothetical protein